MSGILKAAGSGSALTLAALCLISATSSAQWTWSVNPNPPIAGIPMEVTVNATPNGDLPVEVKIYINGTLKSTLEITSLGGSVSYTPATGSTDWVVTVATSTTSERDAGNF